MRASAVSFSALGRRGSWSPRDFLYEPGSFVYVNGVRATVARQEGETVWVSYVENVPGSSTAFSCTYPEPLTVFDIDLRKGRNP